MARSRPRRPFDFWPGFVDAATSLIIALTFVLLIFTVGQFAFSFAIGERDDVIDRLQQQLQALALKLGLAEEKGRKLEDAVAQLKATLATTERERDAAHQRILELEGRMTVLQGEIDAHTVIRKELNRQLEALNAALAAAEAKATEKERKLAELEQAINLALIVRLRELEQYRSELFAQLKAALEGNPNVRIEGERFLLADDILFPSGSAELTPEGRKRIEQVAQVVKALAPKIPRTLPWVLQIEGHTDRRPINTPQYPSNWELSTARAMAVVRVLRDAGIPPEHLAATGYGEYHPIDPRDTPPAYARNRRIELRLTTR
ncbi:peptidoglycan -binding protein [Hydrogenophilus thiooxidans]|uniref:peptidoglycan -binding protein n=1 Tax=Hydrogenophilus thiooxidans TaxID=2820326 RepID=UPI001C222A26|nr:peptidoglycan -binding protein [Hydrogenophilus thiooxidans]